MLEKGEAVIAKAALEQLAAASVIAFNTVANADVDTVNNLICGLDNGPKIVGTQLKDEIAETRRATELRFEVIRKALEAAINARQ